MSSKGFLQTNLLKQSSTEENTQGFVKWIFHVSYMFSECIGK